MPELPLSPLISYTPHSLTCLPTLPPSTYTPPSIQPSILPPTPPSRPPSVHHVTRVCSHEAPDATQHHSAMAILTSPTPAKKKHIFFFKFFRTKNIKKNIIFYRIFYIKNPFLRMNNFVQKKNSVQNFFNLFFFRLLATPFSTIVTSKGSGIYLIGTPSPARVRLAKITEPSRVTLTWLFLGTCTGAMGQTVDVIIRHLFLSGEEL